MVNDLDFGRLISVASPFMSDSCSTFGRANLPVSLIFFLTCQTADLMTYRKLGLSGDSPSNRKLERRCDDGKEATLDFAEQR